MGRGGGEGGGGGSFGGGDDTEVDEDVEADRQLVAEILRAQPDEGTLELSAFAARLNIRVLWELSHGRPVAQHQQPVQQPRQQHRTGSASPHGPTQKQRAVGGSNGGGSRSSSSKSSSRSSSSRNSGTPASPPATTSTMGSAPGVCTADGRAPLRSLSLAGWQAPTTMLLRSMTIIPGHFLERLDVSGTQITNGGLATLLTHCHRLTHLCVARCPQLNSAAMGSVVTAARATLEVVDMSGCPNMCKESLRWLSGRAGVGTGVAMACGRLRIVDASECPRLSDPGVAALGTGCRRVRCLTLRGCARVTDDGLAALCRSPAGPQLVLLDLRQCFQVTDKTLEAVGARCVRLQSLLLSRCHRVSDRGLAALAEGCPKLQTLYLNGCFQITELGIASVAQKCRNLL